MGNIEQLNSFIQAAAEDPRLLPTHISLYVILFFAWQKDEYKIPFAIDRKQIMHQAKISGRSTYQRCIKQLASYGYIKYMPSYNQYESSSINFLK